MAINGKASCAAALPKASASPMQMSSNRASRLEMKWCNGDLLLPRRRPCRGAAGKAGIAYLAAHPWARPGRPAPRDTSSVELLREVQLVLTSGSTRPVRNGRSAASISITAGRAWRCCPVLGLFREDQSDSLRWHRHLMERSVAIDRLLVARTAFEPAPFSASP